MNVAVGIDADEARRLAAVRRYDILDTPPDGAFDRITALAARRFGVPIAIVSIVDEDRIWFKSRHGLPVEQIGRDPGLCASAILGDEPYLLNDAKADPRSLANPLVAGEFGLRFYAAVPLRTHDGHNLGTLCVIDKEPRAVTDEQIDDLKDLASVVMDQLEMRLAARSAVGRADLMAKEIDHRVMNSLQFVAGLLSMQSRTSSVTEAAGQLQQAANRVAAVGQVHRHIFAGDELSSIGFLRSLCDELSGVLGREIRVEGDEGVLPTDSIQSVGLITNELVTNAAKHGAGPIDVSYTVEDDNHRIIVCDQGEGLPEGFDANLAQSGLGMRVVTSLATQLRGSVTAGPRPDGQGACFTVEFPVGRAVEPA